MPLLHIGKAFAMYPYGLQLKQWKPFSESHVGNFHGLVVLTLFFLGLLLRSRDESLGWDWHPTLWLDWLCPCSLSTLGWSPGNPVWGTFGAYPPTLVSCGGGSLLIYKPPLMLLVFDPTPKILQVRASCRVQISQILPLELCSLLSSDFCITCTSWHTLYSTHYFSSIVETIFHQ